MHAVPIEDPSCLADVGVWRQGGNLVKMLGSGVSGSGQDWSIPFDLAGAFEIRVNNVYSQFGDPKQKLTPLPGLEGRQTFTIAPSTATVDTPKGILISGDPNGFVSAVTWSYAGYPPPLNIFLLRSSTGTKTDIGAQTASGGGGSGKGSISWLVKTPPLSGGQELFRYQLIDAWGKVWSTSNEFLIRAYQGCTAPGGILTQDTFCKYNASAAAKFKADTPITVGANGYVTKGTLAVDQDVFCANGKSVKLKGGTFVYFTVALSSAYVSSGTLAGDQSLEWAPNRSATWKDSTGINFYPGEGWVTAGTLRYDTVLPADGAAVCQYGHTALMRFPKDISITCHHIGSPIWDGPFCDYQLQNYCAACVTPGKNAAGVCCCR
jgi:hypothetical protein